MDTIALGDLPGTHFLAAGPSNPPPDSPATPSATALPAMNPPAKIPAAKKPAKPASDKGKPGPKKRDGSGAVVEGLSVPDQVRDLGGGWVKRICTRSSGSTAGDLDVYLHTPDGAAKKLRSSVELLKYCFEHKAVIDPVFVNFDKGFDPANHSAQTVTFIEKYRKLLESGFDESVLAMKFTSAKPKTPKAHKMRGTPKAFKKTGGGKVGKAARPARIVLKPKVEVYLKRQLQKVPDPTLTQMCYMAKQVKIDLETFRAWREQVHADENPQPAAVAAASSTAVAAEDAERDESDDGSGGGGSGGEVEQRLRPMMNFDIRDRGGEETTAEEDMISREEEALSNVQGHVTIERDNAEDDDADEEDEDCVEIG